MAASRRTEGAGAPPRGASSAEASSTGSSVNEVVLVGRLADVAQERELPSGDLLLSFRVVLDRPPRALPEGVRAVTVDTVDCVASSPALRRTASAWGKGDVIRVEGALRRRFWRSGGAVASRYEVEALRAKRLHKAA